MGLLFGKVTLISQLKSLIDFLKTVSASLLNIYQNGF